MAETPANEEDPLFGEWMLITVGTNDDGSPQEVEVLVVAHITCLSYGSYPWALGERLGNHRTAASGRRAAERRVLATLQTIINPIEIFR